MNRSYTVSPSVITKTLFYSYKNIIFLLCLLIFAASCSKKEVKTILVSSVQRGVFEESLSVSGSLEAVNSVSVKAPDFHHSFTIIYLIPDGSYVNAGDRVAVFDPGDFETRKTLFETEILGMEEDIDDFHVKYKDDLTGLSNKLLEKIDACTIEEANYSALQFAPRIEQQKGEILLRQRQFDVTNAEAAIKTAGYNYRRTLALKNDKLKRKKNDLDTERKKITQCVILAPAKGLVVIRPKNPWTKEKVTLGDALRRGNVFMEIPDLEQMQVIAEVNEGDIQRIRKGMSTRVVLDAYSGEVFSGIVHSISALAQAKKSNTDLMAFTVKILILNKNVEILKPGMTARVDFIIQRYPDALYIPIDTVFSRKTNILTVYRMKDGKAQPAAAAAGPQNADYVCIKDSPLSPGEQLVMFDPALTEEFLLSGNYLTAGQTGKQSEPAAGSASNYPAQYSKTTKLPEVTDVPVQSADRSHAGKNRDVPSSPPAPENSDKAKLPRTNQTGNRTRRSFNLKELKERNPK